MKLSPGEDGALVLELTAREALELIMRLSAEVSDVVSLGFEGIPINFLVEATDGTGTTLANLVVQVVRGHIKSNGS